MPKIGSESRPFTGDATRAVSDGNYLDRTKGVAGQVPPITRGDELPQILQNQVALFEKDWLPAGIFPELDALRDEHHRLLDERCGYLVDDLRKQYEAEDVARQVALNAGEEPPPVTRTADREDAIKDAEARSRAAVVRLATFIERALAIIKEKGGERPEFPDEPGVRLSEWRQQFAAIRGEATDEVQKAREALEAAERKKANADQIEKWLDRTVKPKGGRYMQAPEVGTGMTDAERELYRRGQRDIKAEFAAMGAN